VNECGLRGEILGKLGSMRKTRGMTLHAMIKPEEGERRQCKGQRMGRRVGKRYEV
jgi:hypothetical protein